MLPAPPSAIAGKTALDQDNPALRLLSNWPACCAQRSPSPIATAADWKRGWNCRGDNCAMCARWTSTRTSCMPIASVRRTAAASDHPRAAGAGSLHPTAAARSPPSSRPATASAFAIRSMSTASSASTEGRRRGIIAGRSGWSMRAAGRRTLRGRRLILWFYRDLPDYQT